MNTTSISRDAILVAIASMTPEDRHQTINTLLATDFSQTSSTGGAAPLVGSVSAGGANGRGTLPTLGTVPPLPPLVPGEVYTRTQLDHAGQERAKTLIDHCTTLLMELEKEDQAGEHARPATTDALGIEFCKLPDLAPLAKEDTVCGAVGYMLFGADLVAFQHGDEHEGEMSEDGIAAYCWEAFLVAQMYYIAPESVKQAMRALTIAIYRLYGCPREGRG